MANARAEKTISVVVPAFNEEAGIQATVRILAEVLGAVGYRYEIVVIDDGSRDHTFERAAQLTDSGMPVRAIRLSRNFGKEGALLAGLENARGDAVITIDADLQHPPSLIPEMVAAWERGARIVHGVKRRRGDEKWWASARAYVVNKLITMLGGIDVQHSSDFKLLDRVAVNVLTRSLPERSRFYRGLAGWMGFPQATLEFDVAPRHQGKSGWSLRALVALSLTAMVSFTSAPLRVISVLGVLTFFVGVGVGTDAVWSRLHGNSVSGFATTIITLLLIGSFIMVSLGIIGEYIAKIYDEIKRRPPFIIDDRYEHDSQHMPKVLTEKVSYDVGRRVRSVESSESPAAKNEAL